MRQANTLPHVLLANAVTLWGGAERFLIDAGIGLRRRGWRVTVQAQPRSALATAAREAEIPVHTVRTRANGAPWTVLPLCGWLRRERVDVVLTNFGRDLRTTGLAARCAGCGIRVVHSFECDEALKNRWYLPWIFSLIPHSLIFNSRSTRTTVLESAPRLRSVPSTILSKGVYVPTSPRERPASATLELGFLGQLVERKSLPLLLHALAGLSADEAWRLQVAGSGPAREDWESLADRLGLAERVEFCGFVEDTSAWLENIDVLVHPARQEGFGYAPLEAVAAGRSLLARRGGSVEEILGNCPATAWFEDETELRDLLDAWLGPEGPPSTRDREEARHFVAVHYGVDRMGDDLDTLLRAELQRR